MGGAIFISYRRGMDSAFAGRLYDRLESSFGRERVFIDVDSIAPGEDFVAVLESRVAACDVLLALIGRGWLAATDEAGQRRLDSPDDFVRIEIAAGLAQDKRVIPVLSDNVLMPQAEELPDELKPLARRNAIWLTHKRFNDDAERLVRALAEALTDAGAEAARNPEEERQRAPAEAKRQAQDQERQRGEEEARRGGDSGKRRSRTLFRLLSGAAVATVVMIAIFGIIAREQAPPREQAPHGDVVSEKPAIAAAQEKQGGEAAAESDRGGAFRDCAVCPEMVALPGGTFLMGSPDSEEGRATDEEPQHEVTIPPFAVGKHEVTFEEWDACVAAGGCNDSRPPDQGWGRGRRPVINVSWRDAQAYVDWLVETTGKRYRLPSEAEWEYAARAGTTTRYVFGDDITVKDANFAGNVGKTMEVGAYPANAWGLYDTHGNVWEWVEDAWHDSDQGAPADGSAWADNEAKESSGGHVIRGGSWGSYPRYLRTAVRNRLEPKDRNDSVGFRVARTLD